MTFTTLTFLLFVPLVFGLYWSLPRQGARNLLLVAASRVYAWPAVGAPSREALLWRCLVEGKVDRALPVREAVAQAVSRFGRLATA